MSAARVGIIERYRAFLPPISDAHLITLHEGATPLVPAPRLAAALGAPRISLYLKLEGMNPTGSFKDRGMTVAVSKACEEGARAVITASTGNTSASAAAYAARADLKCVVLVPDGNIALGKLSQALIHGAQVFAISGNFDDALNLVREIAEDHPVTIVNSINPMRLEGQKTAAFEIVDALGDAPDFQFMPVGNAGNITGAWMGYTDYHRCGQARQLPKMMGFQADGAAPIVRGEPVAKPSTIATAIRIGNPASWTQAVAARDDSGGMIGAVSDEEILSAYGMLATCEGVFCEPASAAGVAGLKKAVGEGRIPDGATVVCILTGHGLKDPECAIQRSPGTIPVKAEKREILDKLAL